MAKNIDQTIGMQLDADFEAALEQMQRVIDKFSDMISIMGNLSSSMRSIDKMTKMMKSINNLDANKLDDSLESAVNSIKKFNDQLQKMNASAIEKMAAAFERLMTAANAYYSRYQSMTQMPIGNASVKDSAMSRSKRKISTAVDQMAPLKAKTEEASKSIRKMEKDASKLGDTLKRAFSLGNLIYFANMLKNVGRGFANLLLQPIDFAETENLFTAAFGRMRDEAYEFAEDLSEAFGLALPNLLQMEATFKNMLGSLGGLQEETSTMLSETLTKMTIDFASLYNVSIEAAAQKMQSALSRQVRPIRSVSGYDITQNVLGSTAESIGITDRTIRDMGEMEKRLLIIITLQQQMARSSALGDFGNTINSTANQLKILQEQLSETGRWIGSVFAGTIGKVLPYVNGFIMAIKELIKSLAFLVGYEEPDSGGIDRNIFDQMDTGIGDINSGLDDTNSKLDSAKKKTKEWKNFLASFDVANVIPDQSDSDTGTGGSAGGGGVASGFIDPRILAALQDYDNLMGQVNMKAKQIRDTLLDAASKLGTLVNDHIFKPITKSWEKYGAPIIENVKTSFANLGYIMSDAISIIADKWDPFFQNLSDLFFSLIDTITLIGSTASNLFRTIWDSGGEVLFRGIVDLATAFLELATAINDNFVKPVIRTLNNTLVPIFGKAIGIILGLLGGVIKAFAQLIEWIAKCKPLVIALGSAFTALFITIKIAKFIELIESIEGTNKVMKALKKLVIDNNPLLSKLWNVFSSGKGKISSTGNILREFNILLASTKAGEKFGDMIFGLAGKAENLGVKLIGTGTSAGNLAGTLMTKLGSALTWLAANPIVAVVAGIGTLIAAFALFGQRQEETEVNIEDCSQAVQDQAEEIAQLSDSMNQANETYKDSLADAEANAISVEKAIEDLNSMASDNQIIDNDNLIKAETYVDKINDALGEQVVEISNGKLEWKKSNDELREMIDNMKERAKQEAVYQLMLEYEKDLIKALQTRNEVEAKISELTKERAVLLQEESELVKKMGEVEFNSDEYNEYQERLTDVRDRIKEINDDLPGLDKNFEDASQAVEDAQKSMENADKTVEEFDEKLLQLTDSAAEFGEAFEKSKKKALDDIKSYNGQMTSEEQKLYSTLLNYLNKYGINVNNMTGKQYSQMLSAAEKYNIDLNSEMGETYAQALSLLAQYGVDMEDENNIQHAARLIQMANNGESEGIKFVQWLKSGTASQNIDPEVKSIMKKAGITVENNSPTIDFKTESKSSVNRKVKSALSGNYSINVAVDFILGQVSGAIKGAFNFLGFSKRAEGGFPSVGEMFIARESGPEMVGTLGGRTAVANNYQIEDGIYRAVKAALGGLKLGGDLHLTIQNEDGTKIEKIIRNYNDYISRNGGKGGFLL